MRQRGVGLLRAAAVVGLVHAAFTVYWAAGGRWLLRTVGTWAVQLADSSPRACAAVLSIVALLTGYGLLNVVVGWAVLGGLITTPDGYDWPAELGHAALWDPLFLFWGLLLVGGLTLTRGRPGQRVAIPTSAS